MNPFAGALIQLIANERNREFKQPFSVKQINRVNLPKNLNGNLFDITIPRTHDQVSNFYFHIKLNPAPAGYRYKRLWPFEFIKEFEITNSEAALGSSFHRETGEWIRMSNYMNPDPRFKELFFDFDANTRSAKSRYSVETIIKIPKLFNVSTTGMCCPHIGLCANVSNFLEIDENNTDPNANQNINVNFISNLINVCDLCYEVEVLDSNERKDIATNCIEQFYSFHEMQIEDCNTQNISRINCTHQGLTSTMYLHILDQNNNEIDHEIIANIKITLDGLDAYLYTGLEAQLINETRLPHNAILYQNPYSKNLYAIPYWNGVNEETKEGVINHGLNLNQINTYQISIVWKEAPQNVKVIMAHRINAKIITYGGVTVRDTTLHSSSILEDQNVLLEQKGNNNQIINEGILNEILLDPDDIDNTRCIISFINIEDDMIISQCNQCKKVCINEQLNRWLNTNQSCPSCRQRNNPNAFIVGKAKFMERIVPAFFFE
jgi:hypothetical protein